ncbi:hypothetical protein EYB26_007829 [Talaromyces marneffei]|uniref:uncharacterized protein n=1 Tax=Talaromyces marneffei TaxID=37727 RepID=UPI0012A79931|nr:uncharacterized protein EYB26_007829 [Talaromyces marneffei]QGA20128.1 hypothetical protein EYB26_007829 [Talaromyces marneffei]
MWAAQHASVPPRTSAKNLDLSTLTQKSNTPEEPTTYPQPTEMWLGKHQRSIPSQSSDQYQYSVPSLSPRSSISHQQEDDEVSSQASGSTSFSATHYPSQRQGVDRVHVHILAAERYEPSLIDGVEVEVEEADLKSPFINGLDDEPGPGVHDSLISFHTQELNYIDQRRNVGMLDSPPLTARPGSAIQPNDNSENDHDHTSSSLPSSSSSAISQIEPTGPLSNQLHNLFSQITLLESSTPTVMAADHAALQQHITTLELEKSSLLSKREALYSLRDEDVSNLIKIRGLLCEERRAHEALRKLRDEDLQNVLELRNKLAQATWANQSRLVSSPPSAVSTIGSISYRRMEKAQSLSSAQSSNQDLWQTAKTAALEQRVLELESANADLRQKIEKSGNEIMHSSPSTAAAVASTVGYDQQQQQPGVAALAELGLRAMRERESHSAEIEDVKCENLRLKQQVQKMKYQLETSQAVIECFSQMLKSH